MIRFKLTPNKFVVNTFFTAKGYTLQESLRNFGYIVRYSKQNKKYVVYWYSEFIKSELLFSKSELQTRYKSILPYYNTTTVRGNIWKYSYRTLLSKIDKDYGFGKIEVDRIVLKKNPKIHDKVKVCDAAFVLRSGIKQLDGVIEEYYQQTKDYRISLPQGHYVLNRTSFTLLPQDDFILLNIRCFNMSGI